MTMIGERPAEAAGRTVPGHWEGDLITGAANRSAIGTLVDREPVHHLAAPARPAAYRRGGLRCAGPGDGGVARAAAPVFDLGLGKEMALHAQITEALGMPVFFCDPHSPWQRPTNENTNGLLRQYFPKGSDLRRHGPEQLAAVAAELNDRPRKTLGWDTPAARLAASLAQDPHS